jgi:CRISPR-associated protein Cas1
MPTFYLTEAAATVHRESEDTLRVQIPEKPGKNGEAPTPARAEIVPLIKIEEVVVLGDAVLTTAALHLLLARGVEVTYLDGYGRYKGRLSPPASKHAILRLAQFRAHEEMRKRSVLARCFVLGKLSNQRQRLQRYQRARQDADLAQAIKQISDQMDALMALSLQPSPALPPLMSGEQRVEGTSLGTILGMEGAGSAAYFRCFSKLISDQQQWPFPGRVKRPPTDPVNALLSFGYALLTSKVASAVQAVGFDPFVGYLHSAVYGRPALALDLMEEFRPVIVDAMVLTLLNHRMLKREDFVEEVGAYRLKEHRLKVFFTQFEERLNEEIQHPLFGYKTTYRRCLELQARLLAKTLTGEIDEYPPLLLK